MRWRIAFILAGAFLVPRNTFLETTVTSSDDGSVLQLRVVKAAGETIGTCVLIDRENHTDRVDLYFLTSSRLFRDANIEWEPPPRAVAVLFEDGQTLDVKRQDLFLVGRLVADVAVFRVTTTNTVAVARRLNYNAVSPGDVFSISGFDQHRKPVKVAERVRFASTRLALGDRDASVLVGCVGAPAILQVGVFGVVSECNPNRPPVISLLAFSRRSIERRLPRRTTETLLVPQFDFVTRPRRPESEIRRPVGRQT